MTISNIQRGFRKLGDFTFNQNAVSLQLSTSSDIFPQPSTSQHIFSSPSTSHETLPKYQHFLVLCLRRGKYPKKARKKNKNIELQLCQNLFLTKRKQKESDDKKKANVRKCVTT